MRSQMCVWGRGKRKGREGVRPEGREWAAGSVPWNLIFGLVLGILILSK